GIIEGGLRNSKLKVEPFLEDEMHIVVSANHRLAKDNKTELRGSDLANETWIVRENGSGTREATEHVFQLFGLTPKIMEFGSNQLIKESVEAGLGVSLLSK